MKVFSTWPRVVAALAAASCTAAPSSVRAPVVVELPPVSAASSAPSAALPPGSAAALEAPRPSIVGQWEGIGQQSDGATWAMQVEILSLDAGRCATVGYPSIPCASEWICAGASDGTSLRAHERVTENRSVCIDGDLTASLTPAGELEFHWTGKDATGTVTADAMLRRSK